MVGLDVGKLDPSRWNLFTSRVAPVGIAVAAIACGPVIGTEDSDTDDPTATSTPTDPTDPTDPTNETIDPTQGECASNDDCGYAEQCINGFCEYDPDCYCGGCGVAPPPGAELRCSDIGPYYECYDDYACGEGNVCEYGYCQPGPVDCSQIPLTSTSIELEFSTPSELPVAALAFADVSATPGAELLVARGNAIELVTDGALGLQVVQTPTDVLAFAAADFDGDLVIDIVTAEDGDAAMLRLWHGIGDGQFEATALAQPLNGARALFAADRDGDLAADVVAHVGRDVLIFPTIDGVPLGEGQLVLAGRVDTLGVIDIGSNGVAELAFGEASAYWLFRELQSPEPEYIGEADGELIDTLVVADFSGDGEPELAGLAAPGALMTFLGEVPGWGAYGLTLDYGYTDATAGDLDGDGRADLAILEPEVGNVLVRYGSASGSPKGGNDPYRCDTRYAIEAVGHRIESGDHDGDGRAELAIGDGSRVVLVRF